MTISLNEVLTEVERSNLWLETVIQVGDSKRVDGRGACTMQHLSDDHDEHVARQTRHLRQRGTIFTANLWQRRIQRRNGGGGGHSGPAHRQRSQHLADLVVTIEVGDEVRQREQERSETQQKHTGSDPARLVTTAADVADWDQTKHRGDVVAARHETRLFAGQLKTSLDRRDDHTHKPVHDHTLTVHTSIIER